MPRILDRSPFLATTFELAFRGERVRVRHNQIILWVTLTPARIKEPNPAVTPFPVILDTGHNHTFSISERQLISWAGLRPEVLPSARAIRERGQRISLREANVWAHPSERHPGSTDGVGAATH